MIYVYNLPPHTIEGRDQERIGVCTQRIITSCTCTIFNHFNNKPDYDCLINIILNLSK
jgi:hypothetical protein